LHHLRPILPGAFEKIKRQALFFTENMRKRDNMNAPARKTGMTAIFGHARFMDFAYKHLLKISSGKKSAACFFHQTADYLLIFTARPVPGPAGNQR
jgi:hypothetical protein